MFWPITKSWSGKRTRQSKCIRIGDWSEVAARPKAIQALSSFNRRVTASPPSSSLIDSMSSKKDFTYMRSMFFFLRLCSGLNNFTGTICTCHLVLEINGQATKFKGKVCQFLMQIIQSCQAGQCFCPSSVVSSWWSLYNVYNLLRTILVDQLPSMDALLLVHCVFEVYLK